MGIKVIFAVATGGIATIRIVQHCFLEISKFLPYSKIKHGKLTHMQMFNTEMQQTTYANLPS